MRADHPVELSPDDALLEDGRLPRRWQHSRHQASSGITLSPDDALLEDGRLPRRWQHSRHQASPGITLNNQYWCTVTRCQPYTALVTKVTQPRYNC